MHNARLGSTDDELDQVDEGSHYIERNKYTLSEYERLALASGINLSDGHARHSLSSRQREIVGSVLELFDISLSRQQKELEEDFLLRFYQCAAQDTSEARLKTFLTFSSSSAIKMAAQYCRIRGLRVYLIEPCFDNIVHLLNTEGVPVIPIREDQLCDVDFVSRCLNSSTALWLVQPNNPTGFCLDANLFRELIDRVARCKAFLIVDFCFRFYADVLKTWNQYRALSEAGVSFICFEDTGKTWSLADIKIGITACSADVAPLIYRLHDELLLNVSPLHLVLLTEFIKDTVKHGFYDTIRRVVEINRQQVHILVQKDLAYHATRWCHNVPMELLSLPRQIPSTIFWGELRRRGVDILPAYNYFWSRPLTADSLFRIPLSRPQHELEVAVPIIEQTLFDWGVS
jgi:aspartate/methionine/tyrosine aminotransferase